MSKSHAEGEQRLSCLSSAKSQFIRLDANRLFYNNARHSGRHQPRDKHSWELKKSAKDEKKNKNKKQINKPKMKTESHIAQASYP